MVVQADNPSCVHWLENGKSQVDVNALIGGGGGATPESSCLWSCSRCDMMCLVIRCDLFQLCSDLSSISLPLL